MEDPKVSTFFEEWDRIFGIVYGVDLDRANRHLPVLQRAYGISDSFKLKTILFAVHTYYALLMKLLAAELVAMQRDSLIDSYLENLPSSEGSKLRRAVERIESGDLFAHFSVQNFLEADFFGWYLSVWSEEVEELVREMVRLLVTFEPATGVLDPRPTQDLLKRLYQYLIPREIRHDLGEFYTPNWLADVVIDESGYQGEIGTRVLDPACGSGTFLINAINRIRQRGQKDTIDETRLAESILRDVVGFELNPLAVIAARTNYLLAMGPLVRTVPLIEIPVYLCDSILAPAVTDLGLLGEDYEFRTSAATFRIPAKVIEKGELAALTALLSRCLEDSYTPAEFQDLAKRELSSAAELSLSELGNLYRTLVQLKVQGRDGVWVRVIRNAFAPLTCGVFDLVIGNPPWVNWQSLSSDYREATLPMWTGYGLFSLRGHAARLGGGKKDISALMLYKCVDAYLRNGGRLAFLLTQTLLKTKGAGDGFRRFQLGTGVKMKVRIVHDLTALQPFERATTQTAIAIIDKGSATSYPVKYIKWRKIRRLYNMATASLGEVEEACAKEELAAAPIDSGRITSPWMTAPAEVDAAVRGILGKSPYRAFAGVCTWANGIYWLEIREKAPSGLLRVRNLANEAKEKNVEEKDALLEAKHVYPLVRSRDIKRWHATPSAYILVPQDPESRRGIGESLLRVQAPRTYRYLKSFEAQLSERSGMLKYFDATKGDAFYSVYNVSEGTFAPFKVMWRQMVPRITAAVVGPYEDEYLGMVTPVTQHVVSVIATDDEDEAYYICGMLNSSVATCISASYSTGKSYGTPSMLDHVPIPRYSSGKRPHKRLVRLSRAAQDLASRGRSLRDVQREVDAVACEIFGVDPIHLNALAAHASGFASQAAELETLDSNDED